MKYWRLRYRIFILFILILSCRDKDSCKFFENKRFNYPQYICTEADGSECYTNSVKAMLLPTEYLQCSSTDTLAATCIKYPYMPNIWLYSTLQEGFDHLNMLFNGFDELFARQNVCEVMINLYDLTDISGVNSIIDPVERGRYMSKIIYLEIVLAQFDFISSLKTEETKTLLGLAISKYYEKSEIGYYGLIGKASTLAIVARILYSQGYAPFLEKVSTITGLSQYINNADFSSTPNYDIVIQYILTDSQNYLQRLML